MGKSAGSRRIRRARLAVGRGQRVLDATPERLAKSDASSFVNPAEIDSSEQPIGRTRQFSDTWIDRLHRRGHLSDPQWFACDWYVKMHAAAHRSPKVVADYGSGSGGAGCESYGQPQSERQWVSRRQLRAAQDAMPCGLIALFEAVVVNDAMPSFLNGRQRTRYAGHVARAAQALAEHIHAPGL